MRQICLCDWLLSCCWRYGNVILNPALCALCGFFTQVSLHMHYGPLDWHFQAWLTAIFSKHVLKWWFALPKLLSGQRKPYDEGRVAENLEKWSLVWLEGAAYAFLHALIYILGLLALYSEQHGLSLCHLKDVYYNCNFLAILNEGDVIWPQFLNFPSLVSLNASFSYWTWFQFQINWFQYESGHFLCFSWRNISPSFFPFQMCFSI